MPVARSLETAEEISDIAFGFMGSKALFSALHVDFVFTAFRKDLDATASC